MTAPEAVAALLAQACGTPMFPPHRSPLSLIPRRYMHDQDGIRAVGAAVAALAEDPYPPPPEGFHLGRYHRLRAGDYRILTGKPALAGHAAGAGRPGQGAGMYPRRDEQPGGLHLP
jgi:hypothetical protein